MNELFGSEFSTKYSEKEYDMRQHEEVIDNEMINISNNNIFNNLLNTVKIIERYNKKDIFFDFSRVDNLDDLDNFENWEKYKFIIENKLIEANNIEKK
jgi:hypothetical protein